MMRSILFFFVVFLTLGLSAQKVTLSGLISDAATGETLIGANILLAKGVGTVSDFEGKFSIKIDKGEYNLVISYVGYNPVKQKISLTSNKYLEFKLESQVIDEVEVVADVARSRETPVAFTNVLPAKIEEELGAQDIPMVLNSTPGVYATQQGGGDGDARITIRGFNQRNVAVMLDGIPVNDMENGWVYWSNWFGLDAVTRSIQVQRGLGASKLAIPSVGGTMNIITKGIENKRQISLKQEINSEGKSRTSLGYTSGKLKNDWGFTLATSYKKGKGYVDETWSEAFFYYAKVDKRLGNHILSLSAMGAPQEHGQRAYKRAIATYDSAYAVSLGVDTFPSMVNYGDKYNQNWGYLERWQYGENVVDSVFSPGTQSWYPRYDTIHASTEKLHYKKNVYHKPSFSLRDFWTVNDNLYISNIAYLSIGTGGGTGTRNSLKDTDLDPETGQINWQSIYDANRKLPGGAFSAVDGAYHPSLFKSSNYLTINVNEHFWYGMLSTLNYKLNDAYEFSGGIDLRSYKGKHYQEVYDLLGGNYCVDNYDANQDTSVKYVGDNVYYNEEVFVRWGGAFGQVEYTGGAFSSFLNLSFAKVGFMKEDYFELPTSDLRKTDWLWKTSYTAKMGANYNLTEHMNVFVNLGYLSKTRDSKYIYDGYNARFRDKTDNEYIEAIELGYSYLSSKFSANVNLYHTYWKDKPQNDISVGQDYYARINAIDILHKGVEVDFIYKIRRNLDLQALASLGDWRFMSFVKDAPLYERDSDEPTGETFNFDADGVHVGDAAQTQYAAGLRYEPIKKLYLNLKFTYFGRHYADIDPTSLDGSENATNEDGSSRDSWLVPDYSLIDLHAGYTFSISNYRLGLKLSVFNLLDELYISDARNNDGYIYGTSPNSFDVNSASVFLGLGRRYNISLKITI